MISLLAVLGCDDGDRVVPRDLAGTWLSARILRANILNVPDTLTLDANGTGRLVMRAFVGEAPPYREEWWTSEVHYEVLRDRVYFWWCLAPPGYIADCAGGWRASGRLEARRTMVVVPTSPVSSEGATSWIRSGH